MVVNTYVFVRVAAMRGGRQLLCTQPVNESLRMLLRFESEALRRDCCSATRARRRWGSEVARRIAMRLQQLEAMVAVEDLAFLPFDHAEAPDGSIEVAVHDSLAVIVRPGPVMNEGGAAMSTMTVIDIRAASERARAS